MSTLDYRPLRRRPPGGSRLWGAIGDRLHGPGFYYNAGNILGLSVSICLLFASPNARHNGAEIVWTHFAGSASALALTAATLIFIVSGEVYHRAWRNGEPVDQTLNRLGDLLSALGIVVLTASLIAVGHALLAVTSGLLMAGGKIGSAITGDSRVLPFAWPREWPDPFRGLVLIGRLPRIAAASAGLVLHSGLGLGDAALAPAIQAATLIVCDLIWVRADLLLLRGAAGDPGRIRTCDQ